MHLTRARRRIFQAGSSKEGSARSRRRKRSIKGVRPASRLAIRSDRFLTARTSNRSETRGRSKKRIVAGAIAGGVGGFFAGGFLGAHIEGDRCDCDDPGVRGFLIGAPIGAAAGAILGAKFLF